MLNVITLIENNPINPVSENKRYLIAIFDFVISIVFLFEAISKIIVLGFYS